MPLVLFGVHMAAVCRWCLCQRLLAHAPACEGRLCLCGWDSHFRHVSTVQSCTGRHLTCLIAVLVASGGVLSCAVPASALNCARCCVRWTPAVLCCPVSCSKAKLFLPGLKLHAITCLSEVCDLPRVARSLVSLSASWHCTQQDSPAAWVVD